MANDRMYLVSKRTGLAIGLGKNFGQNWGTHPNQDLTAAINELYKMVFQEIGALGKFDILLESSDEYDKYSAIERVSKNVLRFVKQGGE